MSNHDGRTQVSPLPGSLLMQMLANIRFKGVVVKDVAVLDLSPAGCMVQTVGWFPRADQRVFVSLPTVTNFPGKVLWAENGKVGLLFDQLLNEAVYEHLRGTYSFASGA